MESVEQKEHQTILTGSSKSTNNAEEYSEQIPADLIIEIVLRLPTKFIARCRCVSKFWASTLQRQDFTESFLTRYFTRPELLFACAEDNGTLLLFSSPQPQNPHENSSSIAANYHMSFPCKTLWKVIHINGLVCIKADAFVWNICNPSTRQCFTLPEVKTHNQCCWVRTSFGYDPTEKQVKVLTITWPYEEGDTAISEQHHQVLTLETDKMSWRRIECDTPHAPCYDNGLCINGVLYYRASEKALSDACMIVCFDVRSEKYKFIRVGESSMGAVHPKTTLVNYKGKLASLMVKRSSIDDEASISFDMWLLQDLGKQEWSKHTYKLLISRNEIRQDEVYYVSVTGTNEFVLFPIYVCDPFYVYYFNLERKSSRRVEIREMQKFKGKQFFTFLDHIQGRKPI